MFRARNVLELLAILKNNRMFINALFESSHRQMNINSALGLIDEESLEELEHNALVEIYHNEVLLGDNLVKFLEAHLVDNFDEELYDYKTIFAKISKSIELYYIATEERGDVQKHLKNIHRHLRRIPNNLLDSLKSIQHHVEFTYRSAATNKEKLHELKGYNEMLSEFYETLDFISRNLRAHTGFFSSVDDMALELQRIRVGDYILTIRDTLIKITQMVIDYIKDTQKSILFHKHITELKELSDRKEIRSKTNMYELIHNTKKVPLLSGFTTIEKKNTQIKFYPDYAYEDEFANRLKSRKSKLVFAQKVSLSSEPIDLDFIEDDEVVIINYDGILYDYLEDDTLTQSFLSYLQSREPDLKGTELLAAYLDTVISNSKELTFATPYEEIEGYNCFSAYAATRSDLIEKENIL